MTIVAIVPALAALAGLLMYLLLKGKAETLGLWLFGAGTLVTLFVVATHVVKLG